MLWLFSIYAFILGLRVLSKFWIELNLSKWGTHGTKKGCPDNPVTLPLLILFVILNGPKSVLILIGIIKNKNKGYKSTDTSTWGALKSHIHVRKSLKRLKSSLCYPREVALCGADRHCWGSIFTDSLEHRNIKEEGRHTEACSVVFSFKNLCSLTAGL